MSWLPDPQTLFVWLLHKYGVPGVVIATTVTVLALAAWWSLIRSVRQYASNASESIWNAARQHFASRTRGAAAIALSFVLLPVAIGGVLKGIEAFAHYAPVLSSRNSGFSLESYISFLMDWSADAWIGQVAVATALATAIYLLGDFARIRAVLGLGFVIGLPLLCAFWLMGALCALEALGFMGATFFGVRGATLDIVPVALGFLALSVAGYWSLLQLQEGLTPVLGARPR